MYFVAMQIRSLSIHGPDLIHCKFSMVMRLWSGVVGDLSGADENSDCD
jgi:hypothetical protein